MTDANWHPDPTGQHELRYWDGTQWTEHVANQGVQAISPLPGAATPQATATTEQATTATQESAAQTSTAQTSTADPYASADPFASSADPFATEEPVAEAAPAAAEPTPDSGQPAAEEPAATYAPAAEAPAAQPAATSSEPPIDGGITGELIDGRYSEVDGSGVGLQNNRMLRVRVTEPFMARQGSMVAYQGNVQFNYQGGGAAKFLKKAITGEGLSLMRVEGQGDVFLADTAKHVHILNLNNSGISVNGSNVLAFAASLEWNVERVKGGSIAAGGLFNTTLRGTGWVAIVTDGEPVVLDASGGQTFADTDAIVAWSAALQTSLKTTMSAGAMIGRGSGEAVQVAFAGQGFVIIQPSEGYPIPQASS